jgi:hypothetical protein
MAMATSGDWRDEPPSELEMEQQRAGVESGGRGVEEDIASPLWVAGLGPTSLDYGADADRAGRPGMLARLRSMFGRRRD